MQHKEVPLCNMLLPLLALSRLAHTSSLPLLECNTECTLLLLLPWTVTQSQQGSWSHLIKFASHLTFARGAPQTEQNWEEYEEWQNPI